MTEHAKQRMQNNDFFQAKMKVFIDFKMAFSSYGSVK